MAEAVFISTFISTGPAWNMRVRSAWFSRSVGKQFGRQTTCLQPVWVCLCVCFHVGYTFCLSSSVVPQCVFVCVGNLCLSSSEYSCVCACICVCVHVHVHVRDVLCPLSLMNCVNTARHVSRQTVGVLLPWRSSRLINPQTAPLTSLVTVFIKNRLCLRTVLDSITWFQSWLITT